MEKIKVHFSARFLLSVCDVRRGLSGGSVLWVRGQIIAPLWLLKHDLTVSVLRALEYRREYNQISILGLVKGYVIAQMLRGPLKVYSDRIRFACEGNGGKSK